MIVGDNIVIMNNSVCKLEIVKVTQIYDTYIKVRHLDEDGDWIVYKNDLNNVKMYDELSSEDLENLYKKNSVRFKVLSMRVKANTEYPKEEIEEMGNVCWYERNFLYPDESIYRKYII